MRIKIDCWINEFKLKYAYEGLDFFFIIFFKIDFLNKWIQIDIRNAMQDCTDEWQLIGKNSASNWPVNGHLSIATIPFY